MLRKRLVFGLIYSNGYFHQSRNFRLQKVGDLNWLNQNYGFKKITTSLDELVILNATKGGDKNIDSFCHTLNQAVEGFFAPVTAGGGIRRLDEVEALFSSGCDKVLLNSLLIKKPDLVRKVSRHYGRQSIVANIDYKIVNGTRSVFISDGEEYVSVTLEDHIRSINKIGVGEVLINSIDQDGTGFGYDLGVLQILKATTSLPIILMGGAGKSEHFLDGLEYTNVSGVATSNLFNFIGDGIPNARNDLIRRGANLAMWE